MFTRAAPSLALLVVCTFGSACAHIDNLGNPPSDEELLNDGSPEQRIALREQYAIAYENGSFFKPGNGSTMTDRAPQSPTTSDNALRYLEFAPDARQSLDSGLPYVARLTASTEAGWIALGTGFGLGVVGSVIYALVTEAQGAAGFADTAQLPTLLITAAFSGILFGGIVGILLYLINDLALKPVLNGLAADGYRGAAKMFNDELERRIEKNTTTPAAAPSSTAPVTPPVPAPSSMPAAPETPAVPAPAPTEAPAGDAPALDAAPTSETNDTTPDAPPASTDPSEPASSEALAPDAETPPPTTTP